MDLPPVNRSPGRPEDHVRTRRFPRYEVDMPLMVTKFWDETPISKAHGRCLCLGEGGLGGILTHELYVGEIVRLEVRRLGKVYASVRSMRGNQYGFEFVLMDDAQRRSIRRFLDAQAAERAMIEARQSQLTN